MSGWGHGTQAWPVAIVGAGPVGLSLALGLGRHGVRSVLLDEDDSTSEQSKAPGIHVRTLEALRRWGADESLRGAGTHRSTVRLNTPQPERGPLLTLDLSRLADEADRPGILILEQGETERILLDQVHEAGRCDVRFGSEVVSVEPGPELSTVRYRHRDGDGALQARYVVGCDGASSFVRESLGLPFAGRTYALRPMLADIDLRPDDRRDGLPWPRTDLSGRSLTTALRLRPGRWRLIRLAPTPAPDDDDDEVDEAQVAAWTASVLGPGPFEVVWANRFRIHRRSSPRFRCGRILLAGDAAHVHSPVGGMGMNAGIHDAENLAWKLAAALDGGDEDRLLDSYDDERRAVVVEDVSRYTDLITKLYLQSPALVRRSLFRLLRGALRVPALHDRAVRRATMLDLDYPASALLAGDGRAAGVRLPNLALRSPAGATTRLHDLLGAKAALLDVAEDRDFARDLPGECVVPIGPGGYGDPGGVLRRLVGGVDGWILVRPDGHIAWARHDRHGLEAAMAAALGRHGPGSGSPR